MRYAALTAQQIARRLEKYCDHASVSSCSDICDVLDAQAVMIKADATVL